MKGEIMAGFSMADAATLADFTPPLDELDMIYSSERDRHGPVAAILRQVGPAPGDRTEEIDMNAKHEPSAEKKALVDALLAIDSRMPTSSAEGGEVAKEVSRRDRQRVRVLTGMTVGFFLLTVIGICFSVFLYYQKIVPQREYFHRDSTLLEQQLAKQESQPSQPDLLALIGRMTIGQCWALSMIQVATLWANVAVLAVMLAAALCAVLLIMATRRATLRQIQASLLVLSEQLETLQQSLRASQSPGTSRTPQEPGG
jgi:hypothetical protein